MPRFHRQDDARAMTFRFVPLDEDTADLVLERERTRVTIPVRRRGS